jgi:hypothetical protein
MFLRVPNLRLVDHAAHHPISSHNEVDVERINDAQLRMAILTNIGESTNHDECEDVRVNRRRPVLQLEALIKVVKVIFDGVNVCSHGLSGGLPDHHTVQKRECARD